MEILYHVIEANGSKMYIQEKSSISTSQPIGIDQASMAMTLFGLVLGEVLWVMIGDREKEK